MKQIVKRVARSTPLVGRLLANNKRLKKDVGVLQLEKGQLEAEMRRLQDSIVNPPAPHRPTNPIGYIPKNVRKNGQAYREYLTDQIYLGTTVPKLKGLPKNSRCLQIGLGRHGDGKFGPGWTVVDLFDPSPAVDYNYDVQDLPSDWSGRFDLVLCNAILEHIPYPQKAINELHRVLKPGGFAYVELPFWQRYHTGGDSTIGKKYGFGGDYWRATVEGLRVWMAEFDEISCGWANEGVVYFFGRKPRTPKR